MRRLRAAHIIQPVFVPLEFDKLQLDEGSPSKLP